MNNSREQNLARLREDSYIVEPDQKFEVDYFKHEDAVGIARLYYAVYGENFPVDHVYDPDELVRINKGDDLIQIVGRTPKGDVVGLYALFQAAPNPKIMEGGSWIVHPDYRGTSLGLRMVSRFHHRPPEDLEFDGFFGQSVCDHLTSQKLCKKFKALPCAFEVESMPPRSGEEESYGYISLLDGMIVLRNSSDEVVLPFRYDSQLRDIYEWMGLNRSFLPDTFGAEELASAGETNLSVKLLDEAGLVKVEVESIGSDFAECLAGVLREHQGMHKYHIYLPLWCYSISVAVEAARAEGFFFGGLLPLWYERDALLLQKLAGTPDFSKPSLLVKESKALLNMVEADWNDLHG
ncbi:hypothetical protein [Maridesulfovibrio sp.]|uniref:hypothetical protein n=1 Tax=Maridesulfovibrio sp. TaxID=2795000 RepID=UPI0029CA7777|nr:hypothetical protein [Maridesulfovibrio sp.]